METIECIFCVNSPSEVVIRDSGFEGRQCTSCGLIFVSPRPTEQEIADLYTRDDAHLSADSHIKGYGGRINLAIARHRLAILRNHLSAGSAILEIGAGSGTFLAEAKRQGFEVYGVELNPLQAEFIRTKLFIPCASSLDELKEATGRERYDLVFHRDVISHFFDPIAEFGAINAVLSDSGLLAFETGNFGEVDHRYFRYIESFQYPDHLFFYGEQSLEALLNRTGFNLLRIQRWSILPQLRILKLLRKSRGKLSPGAGGSPKDRRNTRSESLLRSAISYALYFLAPYRLGAVSPKRRRPQTVFVIARKVSPAPRRLADPLEDLEHRDGPADRSLGSRGSGPRRRRFPIIRMARPGASSAPLGPWSKPADDRTGIESSATIAPFHGRSVPWLPGDLAAIGRGGSGLNLRRDCC